MATGVAGALAAPTAATAVTVGGVTLPLGGFLEIGTIYEGTRASNGSAPVLSVGDELVGVGVVDAIKDNTGATVWSDGDNGVQLGLWFDGYTTEAINPLGSPTPINLLFTGGTAHIYALGAGTFAPTGNFQSDQTTISAGTLWMDAVGAASRACTVADGCASGAGTPVTLESFILTGDLATVGSGVGNGFLNVTGLGSADAYLNSNSGPNGQDLVLGSSFNSLPPTGGYAVSGSIDIRGAVVPLPAAVWLLGAGFLGYLGIGYGRRMPATA